MESYNLIIVEMGRIEKNKLAVFLGTPVLRDEYIC